ncbi:MAG: hypothetical protein K2K87_09905 [Lachnospiraceae bacterium]|nr:hypothetical protein [Lachnospiraceae bacterium]
MKVIECIEPNDNIYFVRKVFDDLKIDKANYKWVISDLDLVPMYHGDYSGIGGEEKKSVAFDFVRKMEQEKVAIVDIDEMYCIFEDTQTIRNGVFICLSNEYDIEMDTYRPKVEGRNTNQFYDERAKYEIRILDGSLFFILQ